jgi:hypothetical protein
MVSPVEVALDRMRVCPSTVEGVQVRAAIAKAEGAQV